MQFILQRFLADFLLTLSFIYCTHKLVRQKLNLKNPKLYLTIISITVISVLNCLINHQMVKIVIILITFILFFKFLFNSTLQKSIITSIYYQIIIMLSETIYLLCLTTIFGLNLDNLLNTYIGTFMTNFLVAFISVLIINFKFIRKIYDIIISFTDKIRQMQLITFNIVSVLALSVFPITIYCNVDIKYLLIFYSTMIILCSLIVFYSFKTQNNYNEVYNKYNVALNSLKDYENMMTKYRISTHENKNLLLTIRAMILNKEKDICKYIDSIVEEKYVDDEKLLFKMSVIPSGGLRATIYSKLLKLKEKNIEYALNIDNKLKTIDLIELSENTIIDISKIISVFIDNAIDEVSKLKNKNIQIDLYVEDDKLNIKVSNNCLKIIDTEKMYMAGYTTKGKNHGYGLSMVRKIIENNNSLDNVTEINKKLISQVLIINYKKTKTDK